MDDRRSLDDTFIVSARMRDVEKTLKNLDRAHKIRVRRRFADPRSTWHELQTTSKIHRKIEGEFERKNNRKTRRKSRLGTLQNRHLGRPEASPATPNRAWAAKISFQKCQMACDAPKCAQRTPKSEKWPQHGPRTPPHTPRGLQRQLQATSRHFTSHQLMSLHFAKPLRLHHDL